MAELPQLTVANPLGAIQQAQSIQGGQQELALRNQQMQSQGLQIQQQQQAMQDQKAMTDAMHQWDGKDYNSLIPLVVKNGASAQAVIGLKQHLLDQQTKISDIAKNDAETGSKNIETTLKKNDMVAGGIQSVIDAPDQEIAQRLTQFAQTAAQQGLVDPQHAQGAMQIAQSGDPAAIRKQLTLFKKGYQADSAQQKAALDAATQQKDLAQAGEADAQTNKINTETQYGPTGPAAKAKRDFLQQKLDKGQQISPEDTAFMQAQNAGDRRDVQVGARKAAADAAARQPYEMSLAKQKQALSQGDPNAAGQLLVDGDATLSELKSRGATPEFIANTLNAAKRISNGQYNAQTADAQFKVAQSPTQVQFFGSAKSLTDKGGTLDQLAEAAKKIPQHQIPAFNSIEDWTQAAAGSGPLAEYASRVLGVADDYSKVMGGGQGSDASRLQAAQLVSAKLSKEGRDGAIAGIRGSVNSQINSRIGDNAVLKRMYGGSGQPANTSAPQSNSNDPFAAFGGKAH